MEQHPVLENIIRNTTLERIRLFGGYRLGAAKSLGISIRTLQTWLLKWHKEGYILRKIPCRMGKFMDNTPTEKSVTEGGRPALTRLDVSTEAWREYEWNDPCTGKSVVARFENPVAVYVYKGCTTHRVVTLRDGKEVATCVPAIGYYGCRVTWGSKDGLPAVAF